MSNQTGTIRIALLIIIVALGAALVYLVAVPKSERNGEPAPPAPSPAPQDETAGWKTYRNEEYGFEVKYPGDWDTPVAYQNFVTLEDSEIVGGDAVYLYAFIRLKAQELQSWDQNILSQSFTEIVQFGEIQFIDLDNRKTYLGPSESKIYGIIGPEKFYSVSTGIHPIVIEERGKSAQGYIDLINQILSTFKFTR